jgi:hypothetical protein
MKQKSQVLVAALVMLMVSLVLCRGIYSLWSDHDKSIAVQIFSGQAFYLAQAALERAKADLLLDARRTGYSPARTLSWNALGSTTDFGNFNANLPRVNANYSYSITCPGSCTSNDRNITATGQVIDLISGKLLAQRTMFVTINNVNSGAGTQDTVANLAANSWEEQ